MEGFVDAILAVKKLFLGLDFAELKPADDTTSQSQGGKERSTHVED